MKRALASMLALMVGAILVLGAVAKLGFIADLISKPTMIGYMNGLALTILVGQLPKLFGFKVDADGFIGELTGFFKGLAHGDAVAAAAVTGIAGIVLILVLQRWLPKIPAVLIMVVLAIAATTVFSLADHGVSLVGVLPKGFPPLTIPDIHLADLGPLFAGALGIALVSLADTISTSSAFAARTGQEIDGNGEMLGIGAANLAAGLFQGFPISSSSSRTPVAEASGARTQLTGVVGALAVAILLVLAPTLLKNLPSSALAAVVIAAAISLFELKDLGRIFRIQRWEFWLSIACFVGVAALGVISGIGIAIALAVIEFLWDGWRPYHAVLGRVDGLRGYHDIKFHPEARRVPGLVLFRWDAPLFFANAELFHQRLLEAVSESPTPARRIIVAAAPVTSIDVTSADMLDELDQQLRTSGIELRFAEMKSPVQEKLKRFEIFERFGAPNFFPTLGAAIDAYLQEHSVDWKP